MTRKMKNKYRLVCIWMAFGLVVYFGILTGCASNQNIGKSMPPAQLKQDEIAQINEQLFASARMNSDPSDYLLGSGDLLQVKVFEAEELDTTVRVSSRGNVTLPFWARFQSKSCRRGRLRRKLKICTGPVI